MSKNYTETRRTELRQLLEEYLKAVESLEKSQIPLIHRFVEPLNNAHSLLDALFLDKVIKRLEEYAQNNAQPTQAQAVEGEIKEAM